MERQKPGGIHFLVGHSHGGTVACYALADSALRRRLAGVVCLSTPFVTFSRRPSGDARLFQLTLFLIVLLPFVLLSGSTDVLWVPLSLSDAPAPAPPPADTTWQEIAGAIATFAILLGARPAWKRMHASAARFLRKAALPDLEPGSVPLLLLRSPSDEASGGLAASQFIAWALLRLGRTLLTPFADTVGGGMPSPRQVVAGYLRLMLLLTPVVLVGAAIEYFLHTTISLPVVPVLLALLVSAALLVLAFSRDAAAHALFVHTSVEPCPPGRWLIHQLGPDAGTEAGAAPQLEQRSPWQRLWRVLQWNPFNPLTRSDTVEAPVGLMHSITYQDARAVNLVVRFVESQVAGSSAAAHQSV